MTDPGRLVVAVPSSMNTVLHDDQNNGGFVFNNEDNKAVTVTGITFDVSFTAFNTIAGPIVLRVSNPATDAPMFDHHLENLPLEPGTLYTHSETGITAPISFTIGPNSQKILPIEALGVHKSLINGTDPSLKITLRSVTTNPADTKILLTAPQIFWSCAVTAASYDPSATSSVFATGQACRN